MSFEIFVWMHLPGDLEPVLAGRASVQAGDANPRIGTFVYSRNYLQLASALPVDPIALPLEAREFETAMLRGCHAALLDAGPDAWGRSIIELDMVPQPSGTIRRMHKLIIGDQGALSSRTNVLSVAPVFGYSTAQAALVVDQVRSTVRSDWESCLRKYGASGKMVTALSATFDGRWFDEVGA